jgi:demethylmenaquinone methyltransferase/2-methoxy-6-polyprenyl-1,4-benzoquinol methylase
MTNRIYPDTGVELTAFTAKNYDTIMNTMSFGLYRGFIKKAIKNMDIQPGNSILDLGCGTGRNAGLMARYIGESGRIQRLYRAFLY